MLTVPAGRRTVGIDLAAEPARTVVATIVWDAAATLVDLTAGASDDTIVELCEGVDRIGIDCPLGWPDTFVDFVAAHALGRPVAEARTIGQRRELAYRVTDLAVMRRDPPLRPLSVAADLIGHAALRCAGLQPRLTDHVDRSGHGRLVEVYPAGSLQVWGLPFRGYKGAARLDALGTSVDALLTAAPWLDLGPHEALCRRSDDAFDAVIASLATRAAALGLATLPDPDELAAAAVEGWIALPTCPLAALAPS